MITDEKLKLSDLPPHLVTLAKAIQERPNLKDYLVKRDSVVN